MDDSEDFKLREKKAGQFAEEYKAEYWSTSSRTGIAFTHNATVFITEQLNIEHDPVQV